MSELDNICNLCPRGCGVSRTSRVGFCRSDKNPTVAKVMTHFWEEPCISGKNGSGAVFFSGCNLGCIFCQNSEISHGGFGKEISVERLREIFRELEISGVNNINLVTPTHYADAVLEALEPKPVIPVIYNCGGYESVETLKRLEGKIQIYLPDMKYSSCELAKKLSGAYDYPERAKQAIREMFRQVGPCKFDSDGILKSGLVVRHMVLPGFLENSYGVIDWFAEAFPKGEVLFSLMSQYTPPKKPLMFKQLNRRLTTLEYNRVYDYMLKKGIERGFCQERSSAKEEYTPKFDLSGV